MIYYDLLLSITIYYYLLLSITIYYYLLLSIIIYYYLLLSLLFLIKKAATIISKDRKAIDELVASLVGDISVPKNEVSSSTTTPTLPQSDEQTQSTLSSPGIAAYLSI